MIVIYLVFCTSYYAWDGGGSTGPRHLVPVLPFFVLSMGRYLKEGALARWLTRIALVPSVFIMTACVAVIVQLPEGDAYHFNPLYEFVFPALFRGELALNAQDFYFAPGARGDASYNLGQLFHLSPSVSLLLPLAVWLLAFLPPWWRQATPAEAL